MNVYDYFAHDAPNGDVVKPQERAYMTGYMAGAGENVVKSSPMSSPAASARRMMTAWMNSPGHRANILRATAKDCGIGLHEKDGVLMGTQLFGEGEDFVIHSFTAEDLGASFKLRVRLEAKPGSAFRSFKLVMDGNGDAPYVRLAPDGPTTLTCTVPKGASTGLAFHAVEKAVVGKVRGEGRIYVLPFWQVQQDEEGAPVLKPPR